MNDMETVSWETSCLEISNGKITANIPERLAARRLFPFHLLPLEYNPENEGRYQVLVLNIPVLKRIDSSWIHGTFLPGILLVLASIGLDINS